MERSWRRKKPIPKSSQVASSANVYGCGRRELEIEKIYRVEPDIHHLQIYKYSVYYRISRSARFPISKRL